MGGNTYSDLAQYLKGTIDVSDGGLQQASRDASMFEAKPSAVIRAANVNDLKVAVHYATKAKRHGHDIALTARNGGTCMSGGPLTEQIVIDMNALNHIGAVDEKHRLVTVQGGVMHIDLEAATHPHNLLFAPYTSSRDICGIGGMIGNNASGEKSVKYGATSENVAKLKMLLSDGNEYEFGPLSPKQLAAKKELPTFEGKLYREVTKMIDDNWHMIDHNHPKVKKNASGYPLWDLWDAHRHQFNMARLFIGSQGTLGLVTEATLKLIPFPKASRMLVVPVGQLRDLAPIVKTLLIDNPTTVETFDWHTYDLAKQYHPEDAKRAHLADGKHLVIFAIYDGDTQLVADKQAAKAMARLSKLGHEAVPIEDDEVKESYLLIRRKSFRMLLEHPHGNSRAMPFIEDTIVGIEHYGEFLASLESVLADYDMEYTYAGHIGDGSIRLVPLANVEKPGAEDMIFDVAKRVYDLCFAFGGSMGVDHNDGILKTPFLERMYGEEMVTLFAQVKNLFDPLNIFNPGKKVGGTLEYAKSHMIRQNTK